MEKDFLGLSLGLKSWPDKEEINGSAGFKDSAFLKNTAMQQWSFSNKVSAVPQLLSFKASQEEKPRKPVHDIAPSSGYMTMSATDAFEVQQKYNSGAVQVGNRYPVTIYPHQHLQTPTAVYHTQEVRLFPICNQPNQPVSMTISGSLYHSHHASCGLNAAGSAVSPPPLGQPNLGIISAPSIFNSSMEKTKTRNASKPDDKHAKLTIFYAGTVHVFDDVPPEKAQAIILLAENRSSGTRNKTRSMAEEQESIPRSSLNDKEQKDQSHSTSSFLCLSSPTTSTSPASSQTKGFGSMKELAVLKSEGVESSPNNQTEPVKVDSPMGSASAALHSGVALPQARKASLARFLEKRKDRVISTSPYNITKRSPECSTPVSKEQFFLLSRN